MKFDPMTKEQLKNLLPEGTYAFEVTSAVEKDSKAGNPMIALSLRVTGAKGEVVFINDWLMQPVDQDDKDRAKNKVWKISGFCHAVGLKETYEKGSLTGMDCLKAKGFAKIKIKADQNGNDANTVAAYLETSPASNISKAFEKVDVAQQTHKDSFVDDDLPF